MNNVRFVILDQLRYDALGHMGKYTLARARTYHSRYYRFGNELWRIFD